MLGDIWSSGIRVRFSSKSVAISDPSAARTRVICAGGAEKTSLGRSVVSAAEPPATAVSVSAAAGTINPATRAPQRALTPMKPRNQPSVIPVARNRFLRRGTAGEVGDGTGLGIRVSGSSSLPATVRFYPTLQNSRPAGPPPQPRGTPGQLMAFSQQKPLS